MIRMFNSPRVGGGGASYFRWLTRRHNSHLFSEVYLSFLMRSRKLKAGDVLFFLGVGFFWFDCQQRALVIHPPRPPTSPSALWWRSRHQRPFMEISNGGGLFSATRHVLFFFFSWAEIALMCTLLHCQAQFVSLLSGRSMLHWLCSDWSMISHLFTVR